MEMRRLEIYLGFQAFSQLAMGDQSGDLEILDGTPIDKTWFEGGWVRTDANVAIAGHSFGGGTVVCTPSTIFHNRDSQLD